MRGEEDRQLWPWRLEWHRTSQDSIRSDMVTIEEAVSSHRPTKWSGDLEFETLIFLRRWTLKPLDYQRSFIFILSILIEAYIVQSKSTCVKSLLWMMRLTINGRVINTVVPVSDRLNNIRVFTLRKYWGTAWLFWWKKDKMFTRIPLPSSLVWTNSAMAVYYKQKKTTTKNIMKYLIPTNQRNIDY